MRAIVERLHQPENIVVLDSDDGLLEPALVLLRRGCDRDLGSSGLRKGCRTRDRLGLRSCASFPKNDMPRSQWN